jgi:hypothetical protein
MVGHMMRKTPLPSATELDSSRQFWQHKSENYFMNVPLLDECGISTKLNANFARLVNARVVVIGLGHVSTFGANMHDSVDDLLRRVAAECVYSSSMCTLTLSGKELSPHTTLSEAGVTHASFVELQKRPDDAPEIRLRIRQLQGEFPIIVPPNIMIGQLKDDIGAKSRRCRDTRSASYSAEGSWRREQQSQNILSWMAAQSTSCRG